VVFVRSALTAWGIHMFLMQQGVLPVDDVASSELRHLGCNKSAAHKASLQPRLLAGQCWMDIICRCCAWAVTVCVLACCLGGWRHSMAVVGLGPLDAICAAAHPCVVVGAQGCVGASCRGTASYPVLSHTCATTARGRSVIWAFIVIYGSVGSTSCADAVLGPKLSGTVCCDARSS
jgi:hypothetical protein